MIYQSPKNPYSHLTVKERTQQSFPTTQLFEQHVLRGKVLDFGCGLGMDVKFLKERHIDVTGYDPYYQSKYPEERFDTIICIYVLNVLLPEEQVNVLMSVAELLKPTGKAYFAVRRDIEKNGYRTHVKHNCKVYQCQVILPYKSILKNTFCEIYEYQHINRKKLENPSDCPYCSPAANTELITESASVYAILEQSPVSQGHAVIIPKEHVSSYFDLSNKTKIACWLVADRTKMLLDRTYQPAGYNVWISIGDAAGQTTPHAHIHVIPRYL